MKKKIAAVLVAAMMALCLLPKVSLAAADLWDGTTVDTSWYNTTDSSFTISTGAQLAGLAKLVNEGTEDFRDKTVTLGGNIDLGGHQWTPIGDGVGYFNGTLDGAGYTISNLAIGTSASPQSTLMYIGLFGFTYSSSIIKNLNVETTGIYSSYNGAYVGVLAGDAMGQIIDCTAAGNVTGGNISTFVGGLAGTSEGDIQNCSAGGDVACGTDSYAGGLVGRYNSDGTLIDCYATGDVTCSGSYAGGFAAYIDSGASTSIGCYATGDVTASGGAGSCIGGFAGYTNNSFNSCFATGNVTSTGTGNILSYAVYVGGFTGYNEADLTCCYASGSVSGAGVSFIGGFSGFSAAAIIDCYASGSVASTGNNSQVGGLLGRGDATCAILRSYARGAVSGTALFQGAAIGCMWSGATCTNCYYDTRVAGTLAGIGYNPDSLVATGLTPDKMTGDAASANMTGLNFTSIWTAKANDSKWYFPQLTIFAGSSNSVIKAASLASVTLTPFKVTFDSGSGSAVASEYGYYSAVSEPADPTRPSHFFEGWYTTSELTTAYDFSAAVTANITLHAKWTELTLTSSDADGKIYTGGRVTLTPNIDGGTWDWDHSYFSATFNSPATFTALKAGTSTITYTVEGVSVSYQVTITKSEIPSTGQDFTGVWVLIGAALLLCTAGVLARRRMSARTR